MVEEPLVPPAVLAEPAAGDPATLLRSLRQQFPRWGFSYDGRGKWTALRGKHEVIVSHSPIELRDTLARINAGEQAGETQ